MELIYALPVQPPPSFEEAEALPYEPVRSDLSQARAKLAAQEAAYQRKVDAWKAAHPGKPLPGSRAPSAVTQTLGAGLANGGARQREGSEEALVVSQGVTEITESSPEVVDMQVDEVPAMAQPSRKRPITQLKQPRVPVAAAAPQKKTPSPPSKGKGRGKAPAQPKPLPKTLPGMRKQFPTLASFATHLSSTPRESTNDSIIMSTDDEDSLIEVDSYEHQDKRAKLDRPLEGLRIFFLTAKHDITSIGTTSQMQSLHQRGAEIHSELMLYCEGDDSHTTHIVVTGTQSFSRALRWLRLSEHELFGHTASLPSSDRTPFIVTEQWAVETIRAGYLLREEQYLIERKSKATLLPTQPTSREPSMEVDDHTPQNSQGSQNSRSPSQSHSLKRNRHKLNAQAAALEEQEEQDGDGGGYETDSSEEIQKSQDKRLADAEWADLAEEINEAERGKDADDDAESAKVAPRLPGKGGFVVRKENKNKDYGSANEEEERAQEVKDSDNQRAAAKKRREEGEIWACQRKSTHGGSTAGHPDNQKIVEVLNELAADYERVGDHWRLTTCRKVIGIVRNRVMPLTSFSQCYNIRGIGESMARKIMEIQEAGELQRLKKRSAADQAATLFARVHGIGPAEAGRFSRAGARTLKDLQEGKFGLKLNSQQKLGLEYYEDLRDRMPRTEAKQIHEIIEKAGKGLDPLATYDIMGSYRRGQPDCGDIDILISRDDSDGTDHTGLIRQLIGDLFKSGLLKHSLSEPHDWDATDAKWMGLCQLPGGRMRRIDFLGVPHDEMPAALIYFTGNDIFNRSLRLKARKMGFSLNQRGLYKNLIRDHSTKLKVTEGQKIKVTCEQDIFKILGVTWRRPEERLP